MAIVVCLTGAACRDGGVRVEGISFQGNRAFTDGQLREVMATRATGPLPWSRARLFDRDVFTADLERLRAFYVDRGYPDAQIAAGAIDFTGDGTGVRLRIDVTEGEPVIVQRIDVQAPAVPDSVVQRLRDLPLEAGRPLDRALEAASRERALYVLRDSGYPDAHVEIQQADGEADRRVVLTVVVDPGPAAAFGDVDIVGLTNVEERVVRRTLTFRPGDLFRQSFVLESQRRLVSLGLFNFAHVAPVTEGPVEGPEGETLIPMRVTVAEARATRTQIGIGYGTEDGPRGSLEWRNLNVMHAGRQMSANLKYSSRLKGLEADFTEPYFLRPHLSYTLHGFNWWRDEPSYTSRSFGGRGTLQWQWSNPRGRFGTPIDHTLRFGYVNESERYAIPEDVLADLTQLEELIALGFDPVTGQGSGRLAAVDVDADRIEVDAPADPTRGHTINFHLERAAPALGGTFAFTEVTAEARGYVPIGRTVLAGRMRVGGIYADDPADVPFSSRYFLGGSTSLRGWGRFQVAPLTEDGLPIGGLAMAEVSAELRFPLGGRFGGVVFVDAGNVWEQPSGLDLTDLRAAAGTGLRYRSPVGIVRADVGYQLNPIAGLRIGGEPQARRWRIHFSIGHAF
ncbi:MAG: BamA/TamA family outer membrane protein [Vicinamibacterales bacterium]